MALLPNRARVVVIGGGVVGTSCLYHLAKRGWSDCVLLEKNELTAGSTWHAAGNVPTFSSSWAIMNIQRYSTELYGGLAAEVDYPMNYHVTGSLRLGHTAERAQEFERVAGMGRYQGMDIRVLSPAAAKEMYPFLETHDLSAVLHDPNDGDIDPAQLTQALAKGARDKGATVARFTEAVGVKREGEDWIVLTRDKDGVESEIACTYVVNAAGYCAQRVAAMFDDTPHPRAALLPMATMSHQYVLFGEVPAIAEWTKRNGTKLPLLRDVDTSYYLRQEKNGLNLGPYERNCRAMWTGDAGESNTDCDDDGTGPVPDDFSFELWEDDLERITFQLEDASARVPVMAEAGLEKVINGPIPYTPDGNPLIGPMPGVPNAFEAAVFTFGICQGGGAGKVLAEWVIDGRTTDDMWAVDPRRFTAHASDPAYCVAKAKEVYGHEYAMHFPRHFWPAGRPQKVSPVHDRVDELGAVWGAYNGWERALWFAQDGDDTSLEATEVWTRSGPWERRVREECEAVANAAGILDLPGFSRFNLTGDGAAEWLAGRITGIVPREGRVGLGYFADEDGRIVTEMSIVRHAPRDGADHMTLITAASAQWHDREWLERGLPEHLTLVDLTDEWSTHILCGPNSRAVLLDSAEGFDPDLPWLSRQDARIAGCRVTLLRVCFAGELGWEIHSLNADTPAIWDAVWAAGEPHGLKPFGMFALDSLRIEKGYRTWKGDLSTDYSVLAAGLGRFVRWDKPDFVGKQALENERQQGSPKSFAALTVEANGYDAPYMSTVWRGDEIVGETTSGAYGYRVDRSIALSMIRTDCTAPGTALEVEIFGDRYPATVHDGPHYDAANERLRS